MKVLLLGVVVFMVFEEGWMVAMYEKRVMGKRGVGVGEVGVYDTTLRDGTQGESVSLSVEDKMGIAMRLVEFGVGYVEAGWPGSNPKDAEFFRRARREMGADAWGKIVAFGSTRRKFTDVKDDKQIAKLIEADTDAITIVGKAWDLHVDKILNIPREENLAMITDSVQFLKQADKEVMIDMEHFFDGFKANVEFSKDVCKAAVDAGADVLVRKRSSSSSNLNLY